MYYLNVLDDFFSGLDFELLKNDFNWPQSDFFIYDNPFEKKKALKFVPPASKSVFDQITSDSFIEYLKTLTGISNLETDPYLHGAGLHLYENGSFLTKHLDYSINPKSGKQRRLNLILYLDDWDPSHGGALELYDASTKLVTKKIYPKQNRVVIFETNDYSLHGVEKIHGPPGINRRILTCFYVSDPEDGLKESTSVRHKAQFFPDDPNLQELATLRSHALL